MMNVQSEMKVARLKEHGGMVLNGFKTGCMTLLDPDQSQKNYSNCFRVGDGNASRAPLV